jgi:hypothetical protein
VVFPDFYGAELERVGDPGSKPCKSNALVELSSSYVTLELQLHTSTVFPVAGLCAGNRQRRMQ